MIARLANVRWAIAALSLLSLFAFGRAAAQVSEISVTPFDPMSPAIDSAMDRVWPGHPRPLSTCAGSPDAIRKESESFYLRASIDDSTKGALTTQTDLMAQEVADVMRRHLGGSADSLADGQGKVSGGSAPAELTVIAHQDGSVRRFARSLRGDTTATALLLEAFDEMRANGDGLIAWPDGYAADSIVVRLPLERMPVKHENSVMIQFQGHPAFGIFHLSYYVYAPALAMPNNRPPVYPDLGYSLRAGGTIMLEFVIDSSGHPVQETMHDVWPRDKPRLMGETEKAYEEFVAASEAAVRDWKFYPARIGACHVPQIVQLPMQYVAPTRSMPHSH